MKRKQITSLDELPLVLQPAAAFEVLGIGRDLGYELIRQGKIPALRLGGRKLVVPRTALIRMIEEASEERRAG